MKRIIKNLILVLLLFCFTYSNKIDVYASETVSEENTTNIFIRYAYSDLDFTGLGVYLYYVEDVMDEVITDDMSASDYASAMVSYVEEQGMEADYIEYINQAGYVYVSNVPSGFYLMMVEDLIVGEYTYHSDAAILEGVGNLNVNTKISSNPTKNEDEPDPDLLDADRLPQTGTFTWEIPVLAFGGIMFLALGVVVYKKESEYEEIK